MANLSKGIHGAPSGKVANLVFCTRNGVSYVRSLPRVQRNKKPTVGQRKNQTKFAFMQAQLADLLPIIRVGFMHYAEKQSAHNAAMSYNLRNAVIQNETGWQLDFEQFTISKGLPNPIAQFAVNPMGDHLHLSWTLAPIYNMGQYGRIFRCSVLLLPEKTENSHLKKVLLTENSIADLQQAVLMDQVPDGTVYHGYLTFFATDGSNICTDSCYLGRLTWTAD